MRWLLPVVLLSSFAFAGGGHGLRHPGAGPSWAGARIGTTSTGLGPAWGGGAPLEPNRTGYPVPLVPQTNYTGGFRGYWGGGYPVYYYSLPATVPAEPAPAPAPVVVEREIVRESPPEPAPPPQVIIIQQPAPPVQPPPPPPQPVAAVEPPKPPAPRTPGPDVYTWTDEDGVVNYSTRPPVGGKAKVTKLATLSK